nr:exopolyphosphatase [uncultured Gellertiella sp.]
MKDPENGAGAPHPGASDTGRRPGKSSRRGKRRRNGGSHAPPSTVSASQSGAEPLAGRPADPSEAKAPRKRKRRRSRADQAARTSPPQTARQVSASAESATENAAERGDGPAKSRRNRRSKARSRRSPQGRPLPPVAPQASVTETARPGPDSPRPVSGGDAQARASARGPRDDDLYAALDLGTNNCRLLVAQPGRPGQFRVVDAFSRIVRLGEGLAASGRLSEEAMDRAVEALRICAAKIRNRDIRRMRLIATEACRQAANGESFLERVTAETGLDLEIINRETEARLAVSGCSSLVGREARSVVLFDIGGGSSEIAVLDISEQRASRLAHHITHWTSLPVGVVTLSERHGGKDVTPDVFSAMVTEVEGMLDRFDCPVVPRGGDGFYLIGTSGTVTTLAGVHLNLPRYDRRQVDGLWLSDPDVTAMQAKLLSWNFAERAANACIGPDRADLVLAGCAILEAIRRRWPSERMRVADRGLREGLLTDMMADDGVWSRSRMRRNNRNRER